MMLMYNADYFVNRAGSVDESAGLVTQVLMDLFEVHSVVDVGCGLGHWLAYFKSKGVDKIQGYDGPWVDTEKLVIDQASFESINFDEMADIHISQKFDMAICFEVAEHLKPESSETLIDRLTVLSDLVVFSAAIPWQGGKGHINERWQSEWAGMMASHDYVAYDIVRPLIWENRSVNWWYAQNMLVYARVSSKIGKKLAKTYSECEIFDLVHPMNYLKTFDPDQLSPKRFLGVSKAVPKMIWRSAKELL